VAEIDQYINEAESQALESFYLEVLAKPEKRTKKPLPVEDEEKAEEDAESV
jgi:hypothetical protein